MSEAPVIARVFRAVGEEDVALRRIGMATVLRWSELSPVAQESIIQQALAVSGNDQHIRQAIAELLSATDEPEH
ncbi:MAG TPA: hypothetical protein VFK86_08775 [Bauldia sp.]|nr:hypothetical protein [Bauldia sp.]